YGMVDSCQFNSSLSGGLPTGPFASVAIYSSRQIGISNSRIQAFDHGIRCASDVGIVVSNTEIEVCRTPIAVGFDQTGASFPSSAVIIGCGFEGNGISIHLNWAGNSLVSGCTIQGHSPVVDDPGALCPGPLPIAGIPNGNEGNKNAIVVGSANCCVIEACIANGWYSGNVYQLSASNTANVAWIAWAADSTENTAPHPPPWTTPIPGGYTLIACNNS